MGKLEGKVAIITGAASGIGRGTARLFAAEGARVIISDIEDERGRNVASELGEAVSYLHADVSREEDVKGLVDYARDELGRLDCIFNNAGNPGAGGPIADLPVDGWDATLGIHLRGAFLGMKYAAPVMVKQGSGSIISTASVAGIHTGYGGHAYSAAKAAIIHLTKTVAMELGIQGVRVNCICPGGIATGIFGRGMGLSADDADEFSAMMRMAMADVQPIKRAGEPDDIARAALWLASDESSFVNGHPLVVDGGLTGGSQWPTERSQSPLMGKIFTFLEENGLTSAEMAKDFDLTTLPKLLTEAMAKKKAKDGN
jgi:NAD(P)-dependent dehydrogenase (short-subunit alcohol dehydrogenase family)